MDCHPAVPGRTALQHYCAGLRDASASAPGADAAAVPSHLLLGEAVRVALGAPATCGGDDLLWVALAGTMRARWQAQIERHAARAALVHRDVLTPAGTVVPMPSLPAAAALAAVRRWLPDALDSLSRQVSSWGPSCAPRK